MSASQSGVFSLQEFTDAGAPLVGGRLYTYAFGTTTFKTAYTDKAGTIAHTYTSDGAGGQYIALNPRGELPAPLYLTSGSYDIALKTATGATVWTRQADPSSDPVDLIRGDISSTSDASKGDALIGVKLAAVGAVARTQHDKNAEYKTVQDFGAPTDGTSDATAQLSLISGSGLTGIHIDVPLYVNGAVTLPASLALHFGDDGALIIGASGAVTINGPVYANHNPFKYKPGVGSLTVALQSLAVPSQYSTVQRAVDAVPGMIWQDWTIFVTGDFSAEDVRIESKMGGMFKPGSSNTAASRAQLTITGASQAARDATVKVKSFMVINCHGGAYHPAIANMTVTGANPYTNEGEAVTFYGCSGGAVAKVSFAGTGIDKCVMSFGSRVTVEGLHFGTGVNNYALVTKHGGEIQAPDANFLNGELDLEGSVKKCVVWPISGKITAANLAKVSGADFFEWDYTGLRSGMASTGVDFALVGPKWFHEFLSTWQSYFSSTSEFETSIGAGATVVYVASEGINVQTVNAQSAALWIRRNRSIQLNQRQIAPCQIVVSAKFTSVTGDAIVTIGNKGSIAEDGVYFKLTTAGLYGAFKNAAGTETLTTQLCTYAQAISGDLVLYIRVQNDGSVIFKAQDAAFNRYKQQLASGVALGTSTYAFFGQASSAATGTANVTLSEARVARL